MTALLASSWENIVYKHGPELCILIKFTVIQDPVLVDTLYLLR